MVGGSADGAIGLDRGLEGELEGRREEPAELVRELDRIGVRYIPEGKRWTPSLGEERARVMASLASEGRPVRVDVDASGDLCRPSAWVGGGVSCCDPRMGSV